MDQEETNEGLLAWEMTFLPIAPLWGLRPHLDLFPSPSSALPAVRPCSFLELMETQSPMPAETLSNSSFPISKRRQPALRAITPP